MNETSERAHLVKLFEILDELFNESDLRTLCFKLDVDYANLPGETKKDKARELIEHLDHRGRIPELKALIEQERPGVLGREPRGLGGERMPSSSPEYTTEGEEICIDRRWEVATFRQMLKGRTAQRILVFQVPGRKGKTRLMDRFERICELSAKRGEPVLYAKLDFRDRSLSPHFLAYDLVTTMLDNAQGLDYKSLHHLESMKTLCASIKESASAYSIGERVAASKLELKDLARSLFQCLRTMAREVSIVLILDTFEHAGEDEGAAGDWFLEHFVPMCIGTDSPTVVLAGRRGLSRLESSPHRVIFQDTLEPMRYWEDCQRMAQLYYGIKIDEEVAKQMIEKYRGDLSLIDMALMYMRDWAPRVDGVDWIKGV